MDLTTFANRFGTDKGTISQAAHGYTAVYDLLFAGRRNESVNILEIGLSTGGPELGRSADRKVIDAPSIRMWHEFFPKSSLYGLDISDFSQMQTDWLSFVRADCGDAQQLEKVANFGTQFDIIVDDGSHASYHQQLTMVTLFKFLRPGGLYIIEDLDWQPMHLERSLPAVPDTTAQLRNFVTNFEFIPSEGIADSKWRSVAADIRNIVLLDDDELFGMRRMYNRREQLTADTSHYYEQSAGRRLGSRGYLRRVKETSAQLSRALVGGFGPAQRSRVKLALIHKFG
ncbi:MAG: hypothetical protein JSS29_12265 [Proteobacteria bacterium]|nr:hypothetical protein [Pseudomonadota bacterium]